MSAFLGPIHTWIYKKIEFQNKMIDRLSITAEDNNWIDESINLNRYGKLEQGQLEEIVDASNIHGWLQERVTLVENKLAYMVTALTDKDPKRIMDIIDIVLDFGKEYSLSADISVKEAYQHLEALLLNGMPCDRVNELVKDGTDSIVWQQVRDIHEQYWTALYGKPEYYYILRESLIMGILENSGVEYIETENKIYELRKVA